MDTKDVVQARNEWLKSMLSGDLIKYRGRVKHIDSTEYHLFEDCAGHPLIHTWKYGQNTDCFWNGLPDDLVKEIKKRG
jgi:hypothetical protein